MEKYLFTIQNVETGKLNALVNNIMKQTGIKDPNEAIRLVNSGEWTLVGPVRTWTERDGVIRFSVTSDGATGEQWSARLESKSFRVSDYAKSVLRSESFKPTSGVTTEIAVLKAKIFSDNDRITENIRKVAKKRNLSAPNAEVACLIREKFSDKELEAMGLYWIVAMHEQIEDYEGDLRLLYADRGDSGAWLHTSDGSPDREWDCGRGFAFVVSQVSNS